MLKRKLYMMVLFGDVRLFHFTPNKFLHLLYIYYFSFQFLFHYKYKFSTTKSSLKIIENTIK